MKLSSFASWLDQPTIHDCDVTGVSIDTRSIMPGNIYVAIKGERFDGHDFIPEAVKNGAVAVICSRKIPGVTVPQWVVPDTIKALGHIATQHRLQCHDCQVIAVTGSNGKTSVKGMIASILPQPSFSTPGNFNNHIGAPLSLLQLTPAHRYAVFELGANHAHEIETTVAMVKPRVTLINNVGAVHIEGFGSIEGVAKAKGEIHQGLMPGGTAVINDDDAYAHYWDETLKGKNILRYSLTGDTPIHAKDITYDPNGLPTFILVTPAGECKIQCYTPGEHTVYNALAAAACTFALGISLDDIAMGLAQFRGVPGRLTFCRGKQQAVIIDDTYNANIKSVEASLAVLSRCDGRRIFVFGDLGECGDETLAHHTKVAALARDLGVDMMFTFGQSSRATAKRFGKNAKHYEDQAALVQDLLPSLDASTTVLVKGSRSSKMENIVSELVATNVG